MANGIIAADEVRRETLCHVRLFESRDSFDYLDAHHLFTMVQPHLKINPNARIKAKFLLDKTKDVPLAICILRQAANQWHGIKNFGALFEYVLALDSELPAAISDVPNMMGLVVAEGTLAMMRSLKSWADIHHIPLNVSLSHPPHRYQNSLFNAARTKDVECADKIRQLTEWGVDPYVNIDNRYGKESLIRKLREIRNFDSGSDEGAAVCALLSLGAAKLRYTGWVTHSKHPPKNVILADIANKQVCSLLPPSDFKPSPEGKIVWEKYVYDYAAEIETRLWRPITNLAEGKNESTPFDMDSLTRQDMIEIYSLNRLLPFNQMPIWDGHEAKLLELCESLPPHIQKEMAPAPRYITAHIARTQIQGPAQNWGVIAVPTTERGTP